MKNSLQIPTGPLSRAKLNSYRDDIYRVVRKYGNKVISFGTNWMVKNSVLFRENIEFM